MFDIFHFVCYLCNLKSINKIYLKQASKLKQKSFVTNLTFILKPFQFKKVHGQYWYMCNINVYWVPFLHVSIETRPNLLGPQCYNSQRISNGLYLMCIHHFLLLSCLHTLHLIPQKKMSFPFIICNFHSTLCTVIYSVL